MDPLGVYELRAALDAVELRGHTDEKPLLPAERLFLIDWEFRGWRSRYSAQAFNGWAPLPLTARAADGQTVQSTRHSEQSLAESVVARGAGGAP